MLRWTLRQEGPCTIRYARNGKTLELAEKVERGFEPGRWKVLAEGKDAVLLAVGSMVRTALKVREKLAEEGMTASVVNCSTVKPLDRAFLRKLGAETPVFTLEEHMLTGGFGAFVTETCRREGWTLPRACFGVDDRFLPHGSHERLMEEAGLSAEQIADRIRQTCSGKDQACGGKELA